MLNATDNTSAWDTYCDAIRMIVEQERRTAAEAEEAKKARRNVSVYESYDPGDGSTKNGRTRKFATMAAAMKAAEEQYREYKSTLIVIPADERAYRSITIDRNVSWISWK